MEHIRDVADRLVSGEDPALVDGDLEPARRRVRPERMVEIERLGLGTQQQQECIGHPERRVPARTTLVARPQRTNVLGACQSGDHDGERRGAKAGGEFLAGFLAELIQRSRSPLSWLEAS